jgi:hypothetical protein
MCNEGIFKYLLFSVILWLIRIARNARALELQKILMVQYIRAGIVWRKAV